MTNAGAISALPDMQLSHSKDMLDGDMTLIGNGMIRDVYLVEQGGRKLVLKVLREDYELTASKSWVENIHRWEAAALNAVSERNFSVSLAMKTGLIKRAYFAHPRSSLAYTIAGNCNAVRMVRACKIVFESSLLPVCSCLLAYRPFLAFSRDSSSCFAQRSES